MALDDSLISAEAKSRYFLDSIPAGEHHFTFVTDSSWQQQELSILLKAKRKHVYELVIADDKVGVLLVTETAADTLKGQPAAKKGKTPVKKIPEPALHRGTLIQGLTLDSLLQLSRLNGYSGRRGCDGLVADKDFDQKLNEIAGLTFEREKLEAVKQLIISSCLRTDQAGALFDFFDFDDTRLNILNLSLNHIYDIDNLERLEDKFTLSSSKEKFRAVISGF